ncbi:RNA polymerase sigma factor SigW [Tepidibacillus decaturensis]|uniref:RNA polymerase sigma factor SigW n=1 Tax=Tepidibacillus decaturensis TaxID=1413211 RepID=A0A135L0K8_9BACI|nr:RNA polymerase sigma factor SigW [Tepidibacillus decaturensis]KXG42521.1 RNA polymerase subunit sigma [Tepidibacillus decaturensis]
MNFVDKRLVTKAKEGDTQAFAELITQYKDKIFNLAYRMLGNIQEAEDVSQDTFIRVYTNLSRYDDQHKFSTWIFRIATNLAIDRMRKKKADFSLDANWDQEEGTDWHSKLADPKNGPEEEVVAKEMEDTIQQAIMSLPPKYRSIMVLRYLEDLSIQEISQIVHLSESTVKTRLHRGREALRKQLIEKGRSGQNEMS